jgi:3-hydroxy-9,10-secoandrosta-1,3,5(10)-triene-9,17-dione monooxygenase reductase component
VTDEDLERRGAPTFDSARLKQVMGHFCTGVTIITAIDGGEPVGFTAQSFQSLSLDPPLVLFAPQKTSSTWPRLQAAKTFCATGAPVLNGVLGWVEARIEHEIDGGDHLVVIGRVLDLDLEHEGRPLLFYRGGFGRFEH